MVEIRRAYPIDAYALIQLSDVVWKDTYYDALPNGILYHRVQNLEKRVKHLKDQIEENNRIFVAVLEGRIVGFIFYAKTMQSGYISSAEIRSIYVQKEYQRKGIGKELFQRAVLELRKLGYHSLILNCPVESKCISFFEKLGGKKREVSCQDMEGFSVSVLLIYFDLDHLEKSNSISSDWNVLYQEAQENLFLLNELHREIAIILTGQHHIYQGLSIRDSVCPLEVALANMYMYQEDMVEKILILNQKSKLVLPCGRCRDLLISLGQEKAEILFDYGSLQTMTIQDLNPYYKDEEKV